MTISHTFQIAVCLRKNFIHDTFEMLAQSGCSGTTLTHSHCIRSNGGSIIIRALPERVKAAKNDVLEPAREKDNFLAFEQLATLFPNNRRRRRRRGKRFAPFQNGSSQRGKFFTITTPMTMCGTKRHDKVFRARGCFVYDEETNSLSCAV